MIKYHFEELSSFLHGCMAQDDMVGKINDRFKRKNYFLQDNKHRKVDLSFGFVSYRRKKQEGSAQSAA